VLLNRILNDQFKLLLFQPFRPDLQAHYRAYLLYGLVVTWLAGIGRYWDNTRADWWQFAGLGSLAYVFILAALLWAVIAPLKPSRWRFRDVLLFVTMTSLPALLYAIPVERFMPLPQAQMVNDIFLAIVATWRVILLVMFLKRAAGLTGTSILVAACLPLSLIVSALGMLNLEHVVFNIMAGNGGQSSPSGNDGAFLIVFLMTIISMTTLPGWLAAYLVLVVRARRGRNREGVGGRAPQKTSQR